MSAALFWPRPSAVCRFPASCNEACASVLLPMQTACAPFLSSSPMWMGTKSVVDAAASTCPVAAPAPGPAPVALQDCNDFGQLQTLLGPVNDACCTGIADCSSGMPNLCDATCGTTLLPFRASCADFLNLPMNIGMKGIIDTVANTCRVAPSTAAPSPTPSPCFPNPCQNGGWCRLSGVPTSGHRRAQAAGGFTCTCAAGFSGADCTAGAPEQPWCHVALPSVPDTLQSWMDTGAWKQAGTILNFYFQQMADVPWALAAPRRRCFFNGAQNSSASIQMGCYSDGQSSWEAMDTVRNPLSRADVSYYGGMSRVTACGEGNTYNGYEVCSAKTAVGMPCAWQFDEAVCWSNYAYSGDDSRCDNGGAGLENYEQARMYGCVQTAPLPPYECARDLGCEYCVGDVVMDPNPMPPDVTSEFLSFLAGAAESCRVVAEALPPTLFPDGLPPTMLDFTEWFRRALFEDVHSIAEQSAVSMSAYAALDVESAISTLAGEEQCGGGYNNLVTTRDLDNWHGVTNGICEAAFEEVRDNVVGWNGEPLGPAPPPPCANAVQFSAAMSAVTEECCDEPTEVCNVGYPQTCNAGCALVLMPMIEACSTLSGDRIVANALSLLGVAATNCPGGLPGGDTAPTPPPQKLQKPPLPPPPPPGDLCTLSGGLPIWDIVAGMPSLFDPLFWTTSISDLSTDKLLTRKLSAVIEQFSFVPWSLRVDGETVIERDLSEDLNTMFGRAADALTLISQGLPDTPPARTRTQGPLDFYRWFEDIIDMDFARLGTQCSMTAQALKGVDWWSVMAIAMPDAEEFQSPPAQSDLDQIDLPFDAVDGICQKLSQNLPGGTPKPDGQCKTGFFSVTDFIFAMLDNSKMKIAATELAGLLRVWSRTDWTTANPPSLVQMYIDDGRLSYVCPAITGFGGASLAPDAGSRGCQTDSTDPSCIRMTGYYESCTIRNVGTRDGGIYTPDQNATFDSIYWDSEYFDPYDMYNGQGIPIPAGGRLTVEYGQGRICPAPVSIQYDARTNLCCKSANPEGGCASWCQPGAMDCIDQSDTQQVLISQDMSEEVQNYFLAAAVALEQYASNIPETDDVPAQSPWNLNDWIVDFATGGSVGYTQIINQADELLTAFANVDWDNALYSLNGDHSSDETATLIHAYIELGADFLSKHRPRPGSGAPAPAPTCISAFSLTSLPDLLAANFKASKVKRALAQATDLVGRLMRTDWSTSTENMPTCDVTQPLAYCGDYETSGACYDATYDGEPATRSDFGCTFSYITDEQGEYITPLDATEELGICVTVEYGYDEEYEQCRSACPSSYDIRDSQTLQAARDCNTLCDTDSGFGICTHQTGSHEEIIDRSTSDEVISSHPASRP